MLCISISSLFQISLVNITTHACSSIWTSPSSSLNEAGNPHGSFVTVKKSAIGKHGGLDVERGGEEERGEGGGQEWGRDGAPPIHEPFRAGRLRISFAIVCK